MDFMKVIDQTVRDLKREVNIKVLKIPEIEQKVLDATSNEPWGPHGSDLAEIAQATKKFADCPMIMNVLWTRLTDTGRNWRHVYKALAVIEYLMAHGSERVVDDVLEHTFQISSLSGFEFLELNGKDMGINVRKKVETIMALLDNKDKIQEIRNKAVANRDKYVGLSSTGMTYKSSSASYGSGGLQQSDRYGGFGSLKEDYRDRDRYGDESDWSKDDTAGKVYGNKNDGSNSKKEPSQHRGASKASATASYDPAPSQNLIAPSNNDQDDFDDFDPRGSSTTGSLAPGTSQVDLFGESLIDLMDAPPSRPTAATTSNSNVPANVDLFADATFVSASPHVEAQGCSSTQCSVDLFAQQSTAPAFSSPGDLFAIPTPSVPTESRSQKSEPMGSSTIDPFAAFPINNFDGFDVFGDFTSSNGPTLNSTNESTKTPQHKISTEPKAQPKKDTFQVKSGIWADSLSRGLIDLNISAQPAAKKVSLADIGIVGGLTDSSDEKDKGLPSSAYMGKAMGMGSTYPNPRQNQYGGFI